MPGKKKRKKKEVSFDDRLPHCKTCRLCSIRVLTSPLAGILVLTCKVLGLFEGEKKPHVADLMLLLRLQHPI